MIKIQNGFTLVELAIALMVIGLLIGGVLKGQELIENARITRMTKDLNDYDSAVAIFRSIYNGELPGHLQNPGTRLPDCAEPSPCSDVTGTDNHSYDNETKRANFWRHLNRAGLISAINDGADLRRISPVTPFDGHLFINTISAAQYSGESISIYPRITRLFPRAIDNPTPTTNFMKNCKRIALLDEKMDDGKTLSGQIQLFRSNAPCAQTANQEEYDRTLLDTRDHVMVTLPSAN